MKMAAVMMNRHDRLPNEDLTSSTPFIDQPTLVTEQDMINADVGHPHHIIR
jgi:hypothetical protein